MKITKIAVLIPTYNESENLPPLMQGLSLVSASLRDIHFAVYIIDDASPDGTASLAKTLNESLQSAHLQINVIHRAQKQGLGKAYIDGFKRMLSVEDPPQFVIQMDADLSHQPEYITAFVDAARTGADFVVGTRYKPGGGCPDWSWYRKILSTGGNTYARWLLGRRITDYTGGFNMYSFVILNAIRWDALDSAGYGFLIDLKYQAQKLSSKIAEVPIQFLDRQYGQSKMPLNTILKNFLLVLRIKIKDTVFK